MDDGSDPPAVPGPRDRAWRSWLARTGARLQAMRKPLLVVAGVGAALGGLAGYWNAWRAVQDVGTAAGPATALPAATRSLAVLAFANLSEDPADAAFADGVGEELVHVLSRLKGLRVTARRSALQFKGQSVPLPEIARQLQTSYLVDGTVRRSGGRVRISAQLVDGRGGAVLWSGQFERELKDAMAAQAELALQIANSLRLPLDASSLAGSGTDSVEAWQLFMQAQRLPRGERGELYRRVLTIDPRFARVHVELAEEVMAQRRAGRESPEVAARARPHLEAALKIDPRSAYAHGRLATVATLANDLEAMRRHTRLELELDPADMPGLNWSAELALQELRVDDAIALRRRMTEVEPLSALARLQLAQLLRLARRPAQALPVVEQALLLSPDWPAAQIEKAWILWSLGRHDEALLLARERQWVELLAVSGGEAELAALRQRNGLDEHRRSALALVDGRHDEFIGHLERDHSEFADRNQALFDPWLDAVRGHPRFQAWLARHGITQLHERAQAWRAVQPPGR